MNRIACEPPSTNNPAGVGGVSFGAAVLLDKPATTQVAWRIGYDARLLFRLANSPQAWQTAATMPAGYRCASR